jgi:lipopolysaccharide biosynthesis glycosyltransferase
VGRIEVKQKDTETFEVTVRETTTTTHLVTLSQDYYQKLTGGRISPETLIEKSFEFLLERESNTMILARFDLPIIADYFPEYEKSIVQTF